MAKLELEIEDIFYPLYGGIINIPPQTMFWRGYNPKYPAISSRPAYFSMKRIAELYANPDKGYILAPFYSTQTLNILDVRFLQVILKKIIEDSRSNLTQSDKNIILCLQSSFGLCSLYHQIKIMNIIYKDSKNRLPGLLAMEKKYNKDTILEQPGCRVAETNVDGYVMAFLQGLFENITGIRIDGFISPRLISPFHIENNSLHPELILFNPSNSNLRVLNASTLHINLPKITTTNLLYSKHYGIVTLDIGNFKTKLYMRSQDGGNKKKYEPEPAIEIFNTKLNDNDKYTTKLYKDAYSAGKRWSKKANNLLSIDVPVPTIPISFDRLANDTTIEIN